MFQGGAPRLPMLAYYFLGSTLLPITAPTAAPPTVPTVLPPATMAPATPPTAAPVAVLVSRVDIPLQAARDRLQDRSRSPYRLDAGCSPDEKTRLCADTPIGAAVAAL
jgi:hypothetical protein